MIASELISARRAFRLDGYRTLADVGMDGDYVSPLQIRACSSDGPVLLAYNWLDTPSIAAHYAELRREGYLASMPFNRVVNRALAECGLTRCDVYMTQAFHLLPATRSASIRSAHVDESFAAITKHEIAGRKIIAMGDAAASACRRHGITTVVPVAHPSARGRTIKDKAHELARAIIGSGHQTSRGVGGDTSTGGAEAIQRRGSPVPR